MSRVSDNHALNFPARMSDGRQFTDYRPNCFLNNEMGQNMGSWQYRTYLIRNANEIHKKQVDEQISKTKHTSTAAPIPDVKTVMDCTNQRSCEYMMKDQNGLGQGRKY